jgi:hypothetical protein
MSSIHGFNDYTDDWDWIAFQAKERAGWRCEHCNHKHDPESGHTLTVHHMDLDKSNNDPANLKVLCQKCHLHIQAKYCLGQFIMPGFEFVWVEGYDIIL